MKINIITIILLALLIGIPLSAIIYNHHSKNGIKQDYYYKTGEIAGQYTLVDGYRSGVMTTYHKNGMIASYAEYDHGALSGRYLSYDINGRLCIIRIFSPKEISERKEYILTLQKEYLPKEDKWKITRWDMNQNIINETYMDKWGAIWLDTD